MNFIVWFLLAALWIVLGFFAVRTALQRAFKDRRAATISAVLVVAAYAAGYYSPLANHGDGSAVQSAAVVAQAPPEGASTSQVVATGTDVHANCERLGAAGHDRTVGYLDTVRATAGPVRVLQPQAAIASSDTIELAGWAASAEGKAPATAVCLLLDRKLDLHAQMLYGFSRPDVAANLHVPELQPTGFEIVVKPHMLPEGTHRLSVLVVSRNGSSGELTGSWTLTVR